MFGEISFLEGNVASASVIADEDADVYIINGSFIDNLLRAEPALAGRFYHFLACNLSRRLRKVAPKKVFINHLPHLQKDRVGYVCKSLWLYIRV